MLHKVHEAFIALRSKAQASRDTQRCTSAPVGAYYVMHQERKLEKGEQDTRDCIVRFLGAGIMHADGLELFPNPNEATCIEYPSIAYWFEKIGKDGSIEQFPAYLRSQRLYVYGQKISLQRLLSAWLATIEVVQPQVPKGKRGRKKAVPVAQAVSASTALVLWKPQLPALYLA